MIIISNLDLLFSYLSYIFVFDFILLILFLDILSLSFNVVSCLFIVSDKIHSHTIMFYLEFLLIPFCGIIQNFIFHYKFFFCLLVI